MQETGPNHPAGPGAGVGPSVATGSGAGQGPGTNSSGQAQIAIPRLSSEQVERLLSLIGVPKPGYERLSGKAPCMLDSGASTHMAGDASIMENL